MTTRSHVPAIERRRCGGAGDRRLARSRGLHTRRGSPPPRSRSARPCPIAAGSAYGAIGKAELAYFKMINEEGGVNGRKINLISLDDGYSPPKTVEQIRRLVEQEKVAFIFQSLGTRPIGDPKYMNDNKVPQLFLATGASQVERSQELPVDHGLAAQLPDRDAIYAKHILAASRTPRSASSIRTTISVRTI